MEQYGDARGHLAETLQRSGYNAAVAAPVAVEEGSGGRSAATRSMSHCRRASSSVLRLRRPGRPAAGQRRRPRAAGRVRARIVEVGDAERRRLERNLHDGAQQRLVSWRWTCGWSARRWRRIRRPRAATLASAQDQLSKGLEELRELTHGIHPAVLTERGLGPALQGLLAAGPAARRDRRVARGGRLAGPGRGGRLLRRRRGHHQRGEVRARVIRVGEHPPLQRGGRRASSWPTTASAARTMPLGTGLRGLADRLEALDGHLEVDSPAAHGTRISRPRYPPTPHGAGSCGPGPTP